jgi:hypothetical protein
MKLAERSIMINGSLQAVWDKLLHWRSMPDWDILMKSIHFDDPIRVGSIGRLVLKNGQELKLRITQFDQLKDYTDEFSVLGTRFIFYHQLTQQSLEQIKMYLYRVTVNCEYS